MPSGGRIPEGDLMEMSGGFFHLWPEVFTLIVDSLQDPVVLNRSGIFVIRIFIAVCGVYPEVVGNGIWTE